MNILSLIVLALIGEAVWETLKLTWQGGKISVDRVGALVVGLLLALGTGLDLMAMVGVPLKIPYVGMVLTGLLISRGANFVHDLLASINNVQQNTKVTLLNAPGVETIQPINTDGLAQPAAESEKVNPTAENSEPGQADQPSQQ